MEQVYFEDVTVWVSGTEYPGLLSRLARPVMVLPGEAMETKVDFDQEQTVIGIVFVVAKKETPDASS